MFLTGRDGDHERSLVVLVNHSILDGSSLSLWLNEIKVYMNSIIEAGSTVRVCNPRWLARNIWAFFIVHSANPAHKICPFFVVCAAAEGGRNEGAGQSRGAAAAESLRGPHQLVA